MEVLSSSTKVEGDILEYNTPPPHPDVEVSRQLGFSEGGYRNLKSISETVMITPTLRIIAGYSGN